MSVEAAAYVQAAMGLYLMIFCLFLLYNYYRVTSTEKFEKESESRATVAWNKAEVDSPGDEADDPSRTSRSLGSTPTSRSPVSMRSTVPPPVPPSPVLFCLYGGMTLFTLCSSFLIGFLMNNAFMFISSNTLSASYCSSVMSMNLFFFYLHSLCLYYIVSFSNQRLLSAPNFNGTTYPLNTTFNFVYRLIIGVLHLYIPIHIAIWYHIDESVSTSTQWTNSSESFVICTLDDPSNSPYEAAIYVVVVVHVVMLLLTTIPLLSHYQVIRRDHRDPNKGDLNERHMDIIKLTMFYLFISTLFDVVGICIFFSKPQVVGFAVIVMLTIRTSCIYVLCIDTVSYNILYTVPLILFLWIWEKVSPIDDVVELDPHYRWYYKEPSMKSEGGSNYSNTTAPHISYERKPSKRILERTSHSTVPSRSKTNGAAGVSDVVAPRMAYTESEENREDFELNRKGSQGTGGSATNGAAGHGRNDSDIDQSSDDNTELVNASSLATSNAMSMPGSAPLADRYLSTKL